MPRKSRAPDPESLLPLKTAWLHVLLAVAGGHHHGYVIRQEVEERTQGRVRLWPATLYGTLSQLTDAGLLREAHAPPAEVPDDDPRRRYYRLTSLGDRVLEAETRRLEALVEYARTQRVTREAGRA
jgi:DNA-binding PadR family transcriptional regulator